MVKKGASSVQTLIERGFKAVADDIADIRKHMATKDDVTALRKELKGDIAGLRNELKGDIAGLRTELKGDIAGIMDELSDIKRRLKDIEAAIEDHAGHSKEIDHALERIAVIERHLGIKHPSR